MKKCLEIVCFVMVIVAWPSLTLAQRIPLKNIQISRADSLKGGLRPERTCFDVTMYKLLVRIDPEFRTLQGAVDIIFKVVHTCPAIQIDLHQQLNIDRIELSGVECHYRRDENAIFIEVPVLEVGSTHTLKIFYGGTPVVAKNAPWDGGFVWKQDKSGDPWVGVACQGVGASLWWPCKDHLSDEPDSAQISIVVPGNLTGVSNGQLVGEYVLNDGWKRFDWKVSYPINTYNITVNVANYAYFEDTYLSKSTGDSLPLRYYVLRENLEKARQHFKQVHEVLAAFEHYFGPYPFWNDGYKLIETPYLGMEHQSAIAYGNLYRRGYLGGNIPADMHFDYIILHETGHEYFGNAVSVSDLADMWIHESFTTYMESLYVEYMMSYQDALRYLMHQRAFIVNTQPIVGVRGINWYRHIKNSDQYYKGAWILHTLRHMVSDDQRWFDMLRAFYERYKYQIVISEDFFLFAQDYLEMELMPFFIQYFYEKGIPSFEYKLTRRKDGWHLSYRLKADVDELAMRVNIHVGTKSIQVLADKKWKEMWLPIREEQELQLPFDKYLLHFKRR